MEAAIAGTTLSIALGDTHSLYSAIENCKSNTSASLIWFWGKRKSRILRGKDKYEYILNSTINLWCFHWPLNKKRTNKHTPFHIPYHVGFLNDLSCSPVSGIFALCCNVIKLAKSNTCEQDTLCAKRFRYELECCMLVGIKRDREGGALKSCIISHKRILNCSVNYTFKNQHPLRWNIWYI